MPISNKPDSKQYVTLKNEEPVLADFMKTLPGYVSIKDAESKFIMVNQSLTQVAGCHSEKVLIGLCDWDMPWAKYTDEYLEHEQMALQGRILQMIAPTMKHNGDMAFLLTKKFALIDQNKLYAVVCSSIELPHLHNTVLSRHINFIPHQPDDVKKPVKQLIEKNLTPRESQILQLLLRGKLLPDAAKILNLSIKTIEFHSKNLRIKFNVDRKHQLIEKALILGFKP